MENALYTPLISTLVIENARNIDHAEFSDLGKYNLIYGENGSGKTTVLESINMLGLARSFRTNQAQLFIQHGASQCMIYGRINEKSLQNIPVGIVRKSKGDFLVKLAGQRIRSISDIASRIPLQVINADTFSLLDGGPTVRRQFLDWSVFHVEHGFFELWSQLKRTIKQRNEALRRAKIGHFDSVALWDTGLVELSTKITAIRQRNFQEFNCLFTKIASVLFPDFSLNMSFYPGWREDKELSYWLKENIQLDIKRGSTSVGSHRATFSVKVDNREAEHCLSRGQKKLLIIAMLVCQSLYVNNKTQKKVVYLADDLTAELDSNAVRKVFELMDQQIFAQIFITSIQQNDFDGVLSNHSLTRMFHVEHGKITNL